MSFALGIASAAEWEISPRFSVTGTYLDNVNLAPPGEEDSDFVTELNPEIVIQMNGRRADLNLNYRMQNLFYAENSDANTTNHELASDANVELLKNLFFLDLAASYNQVLISPEGRVGFDNLSITDDTTDVGTLSISPYLTRQFGSTAFGELRYSYDKVDYSGGNESSADSEINQVFASFSSSPFARRLGGGSALSQDQGILESSQGEQRTAETIEAGPSGRTGQASQDGVFRNRVNRVPTRTPSNPFQWAAIYEREESESAEDDNTRFEEVSLNLSYLASLRWAALTSLGYENNDFERSSEADEPKGFFWSVGAAWNPFRRTTLEARLGERSFGNTYNFALRHFTRRSTAEIRYFEEFTNTASAVLENRDSLAISELDVSGPDSASSQGLGGVPLPGISTEVFLSKRLDANLSRATGKSVLSIQAYDEERDFQESGNQEQVYGGTISWGWQPTARTDSLLTGQFEHLDETDGEELERWEVGLRITRQIRPDIDGSFEYRYIRQDGSDEDDFEQNSIAATVQVRF